MSSAESLLPIWPPVLERCVSMVWYERRTVEGRGRGNVLPVQTFNLYSFTIFDRGGGGDWIV